MDDQIIHICNILKIGEFCYKPLVLVARVKSVVDGWMIVSQLSWWLYTFTADSRIDQASTCYRYHVLPLGNTLNLQMHIARASPFVFFYTPKYQIILKVCRLVSPMNVFESLYQKYADIHHPNTYVLLILKVCRLVSPMDVFESLCPKYADIHHPNTYMCS